MVGRKNDHIWFSVEAPPVTRKERHSAAAMEAASDVITGRPERPTSTRLRESARASL